MAEQRVSFQSPRSPGPSLAGTGTTLLICLVLGLAQAFFIALNPIIGLILVASSIIVVLFVQLELILPLFVLVAGPTLIFSASSSGILSRLYVGNLMFALIIGVWLLRMAMARQTLGRVRKENAILVPLLCLTLVGFASIIYSHLYPDPYVTYSYVHSDVPLILVNVVEMFLLISLPLYVIVIPAMIRTLRDARWIIGSYLVVGMLYALGTIFAAPLHLYSQNVIIGVQRPQVFGATSSDLGMLNVLFTCLALGQALSTKRQGTGLLFGLLTCIFALAAVLSFGREAWIGLFIAIWVIFFLRFKNPFMFLLPLIILPFLPILFPGVLNFFDPTKVYGFDRINIWQDALAIWQHSPYMGVGAGNYQFFDLTYGTEIAGVAHNQFLGVLAEMGVQGLVCLLFVIVMIGRAAFKRFKTATSDTGKGVSLAYMGFYAALLCACFFTGPFVFSTAAGGGTEGFVEASYLWIFLGLVLSIPNWDGEAATSEPSVELSSPAVLRTLRTQPQKGLVR